MTPAVEALPLLQPTRLFSWAEIAADRELPPKAPGVYAWYFDDVLARVPTADCVRHQGHVLLYIGIAPGNRPSVQNLRSRVRYHFRGNAEGSTLRLTLGCLLAESAGFRLRRVGNSGSRMTFGKAGEQELTAWLATHARICWVVRPRPWELEEQLLQTVALPLNLDQNRAHAFHSDLTALRAEARARARLAPKEDG